MKFLRQYPFSVLFIVTFVIAICWTLTQARRDWRETVSANNRADDFLLDSFGFRQCVDADTGRFGKRLLTSVRLMKIRKDDALDDAMEYYEELFIFAHLLGFFSVLGSVAIFLLVKDGWQGAATDVKIAMGCIFVVCSVCYFIPRLMNNELNYKSNIGVYFALNKQMNYSAKILSSYCSSEHRPAGDTLLRAAADSNFSVIHNNLAFHYDIKFEEAAKLFEDLQKDNKVGK